MQAFKILTQQKTQKRVREKKIRRIEKKPKQKTDCVLNTTNQIPGIRSSSLALL